MWLDGGTAPRRRPMELAALMVRAMAASAVPTRMAISSANTSNRGAMRWNTVWTLVRLHGLTSEAYTLLFAAHQQ